MKHFLSQTAIFICALLISLAAVEAGLVLLNSNGKNYNIEMWKYSKELKLQSHNKKISHVHKKSSEALLQGVSIRTNSYGMRGIEPASSFDRRIQFIGSSITMGWGVEESEIFSTRIAKKFRSSGQEVDVLNSGVGNHNATRYVENFFVNYTDLKPTDIVVHYFLNDAEILPEIQGNFITKNFQLGVLIWRVYHQIFGNSGADNLKLHYRKIYDKKSPGFDAMITALSRLSEYCNQNDIRLYIAMVPDIHNLQEYPYAYIHEIMKNFARSKDIQFIDFLNNFQKYEAAKLWNMPNDPHPNAIGHQIMADTLFPVLLN